MHIHVNTYVYTYLRSGALTSGGARRGPSTCPCWARRGRGWGWTPLVLSLSLALYVFLSRYIHIYKYTYLHIYIYIYIYVHISGGGTHIGRGPSRPINVPLLGERRQGLGVNGSCSPCRGAKIGSGNSTSWERKSSLLTTYWSEATSLHLPSYTSGRFAGTRSEIGISSPNNQRQQHTLHIQEDVLPDAMC